MSTYYIDFGDSPEDDNPKAGDTSPTTTEPTDSGGPQDPHADTVLVNDRETSKTSKAINEIIEDHSLPIEASQRICEVSAAKVRKARQVVSTKGAEHAEAIVEDEAAGQADADAKSRPNETAVRRVGTVLTALVVIGVASVAFLIDRVLLRGSFVYDTLGTVTLLALVIGIGQAITAHIAGDAHSDYQHSDQTTRTETEWRTYRNIRNVALVLGIGSNISLGVLRALDGGVIVALLLTAVGIGLWLFGFWVAYLHASPTASQRAKSRRRRRHTGRVYATAVSDWDKAEKLHAGNLENQVVACDAAVAEIDHEVKHLQARLKAKGLPTEKPRLPLTYANWQRIANRQKKPEHTLDPFQAPSISAT